MDNVFQADDCDAFDSDMDEAPTTQTMFMANLSSTDPVTDEARPSYDSDILSKVPDHELYQDAACAHHEGYVTYDSVLLNHVVGSHADYMIDSNMIPYDQFVTTVKLNRELRDSNYDQHYAYLKQHETHAKENKMMLECFSQPTVDPLALMLNVSNPQNYSPSSLTSSSTQVLQPLADSSLSPAESLIENLTNTLALLTQSYKTFLPQTNNQLRTSSNARNQATVQDGRVVVQNVQGRQNRGQGMNLRCGSAARYGRLRTELGMSIRVKQDRNSKYYKDKMLLMQAQENGVALDEEQLLFLAGGQDNAFDDDVDEQPVQDLALNVDNIFQADDCDAFDSDVDEAPTAQTMFMANLSFADPVTDEAGPSYDSDIISKVHGRDHYQDAVCAHHEEHVMHDSVQLDHVVNSHADYTSDSNMISYDQYVKDNEVPVVHSNVSSVLNDAFMMIYNDIPKPHYNELNKVAIGYKNPLCLTRAKQVQPALYNGLEIIKDNHAPTIVHNTEDTLEIAEITRKKMNAKMNDPECVTRKLKSEALKEQTKVSRPIKALTVYLPNTPATLVPKVLPTKSQVKIHIFTLIQLFLDFDKTCKKRITPTGLTEGERGFEQTKECYLKEVIPFFKTLKDNFKGIQKALTKEMKDVFEELEAEVAQYVVDRKHDAIELKNLFIANDNLIAECLSQEVFYVATNSELNVTRFTEIHVANTTVEARCLALEAELANLRYKSHHDNQEELINHFSKLEVNHLNLQLKYQNLKDGIGNNPPTPDKDTPDFDSVFVIGKIQASLQGKDNVIHQLKTQLSQLQVTRSDTDRTLKVRTTYSQITKLTDQVTSLQTQNDLFRAENDKIKQHYKELNNRDAHLDYLRHLKESVEIVRDNVKEAKVVRPLDRSIVSACRYTKHSQELLEYAIGTFPQGSQQRAKQLAYIPLIRKKQVTVVTPSDKSDSNTHKHVVTVKTQKTNVFVPPSTGVNSCPNASGSQPKSNTKTNKISPAKVSSPGKHSCYVRDTDGIELIKGSRGSNLYTISVEDMMKSSPICLLSKASKHKSWLWHRRLNHLNFGTINDLVRKDLVRGLPRLKFEKDHLCSSCQLGKSKKHTHKPKTENTNLEVLNTLHMDLCGPMRQIQVGLNKTVRYVRTDNGTEFVNHTLTEYYERIGIFHQKTVPRTPQQNGVVERRNRTLVEAARTMLIFSKALMFLWAEVVATACYTQNRSLIHTHHHKSLYELVHNKKPDLTFFRVFGALCYPTNDNEDLGKLQPTADIRIFVGYAPSRKGYRIYNKITRRIMETIHVQFVELTEKMASVHLGTGPAPNLLMPGQITGIPSSTTIDKDTPSPSISPSYSALQSHSLHQGVAAEPNYMEDHTIALIDNTPFVNVFAPEPHSEASSSGDISSTESP
nr:hypothetical protein [Tanacetum cinerariifolium]